jgi:hypothetical protein
MENMESARELPKYKCHKEVFALKIKDITFIASGGAVITPEEKGYSVFSVGHSYVQKHSPQVGGYYVVYEDGYKSFSPPEAFEGGYTRID